MFFITFFLISLTTSLRLKNNGRTYSSRTYTVDGLSSGAFFSVDYGVAYSSEVSGIAVVAGGPYYCAKDKEDTALTDCMSSPELIETQTLVDDTKKFASDNKIDPVTNIVNKPVYIYAGKKDSVVNPQVGEKCSEYFKDLKANVKYDNSIDSNHGMVTDYYGTKCGPLEPEEPYIENCGYDLAQKILEYLYSITLKPRMEPSKVPYNNVYSIKQTQFTPKGKSVDSISMENVGYYYKASNCSIAPLSDNCKLHVVFHGCEQYLECECPECKTSNGKFNDTYVRNAGYNPWAETNNFVILYPQADKKDVENPDGCWDWWGYDGDDYAWQTGDQISTVHSMIQYVITGSSKWLNRN